MLAGLGVSGSNWPFAGFLPRALLHRHRRGFGDLPHRPALREQQRSKETLQTSGIVRPLCRTAAQQQVSSRDSLL